MLKNLRIPAIEIDYYLNRMVCGVFLVEEKTGKIRYINKVGLSVLGYNKLDIIGKTCHEFICPIKKHECPCLDSGDELDNVEASLLTSQGDRIDVIKSVSHITIEGEPYLLASFVDITHQKNIARQTKLKGMTDPLTGLYNRRYLNEIVTELLTDSSSKNQHLCALMFDIDSFKRVNDTYGHLQGDQVLMLIGRILKDRFRSTDILIRWGGEEFLLLFSNMNLEQGERIAEELRKTIFDFHFINKERITCSFGVAEYFEAENYEHWLNRADYSLMRSKVDGKNRVTTWNGYLGLAEMLKELENNLRSAADNPITRAQQSMIDKGQSFLKSYAGSNGHSVDATAIRILFNEIETYLANESKLLKEINYPEIRLLESKNIHLIEKMNNFIFPLREKENDLNDMKFFIFGESVINHLRENSYKTKWFINKHFNSSTFLNHAPSAASYKSIKAILASLVESIDLYNHLLKNHHRNTTIIAYQLGIRYGLDSKRLGNLIMAASIHDIGALSVSEQERLLYIDAVDTEPHEILGAQMLSGFKPFNSIRKIIRHHHITMTDIDSERFALIDIPFECYLLHLADRIDVLYSTNKDVYDKNEMLSFLTNEVHQRFGTIFNPALVNAFDSLILSDQFWTNLEQTSYYDLLMSAVEDVVEATDEEDIEGLAKIFSQIVDEKSPWTYKHSKHVGLVAYKLGELAGLDEETCFRLKIAGYLHDIGKIAVPSKILNKPGKLTDEEMSVMRSHVEFSTKILSKVSGLNDIAKWASFHHEKYDGTGYPLNMNQHYFSKEMDVLAFADIFSALFEERPYRKAMNKYQIIETLGDFAPEQLNKEIYLLVIEHFDELSQPINDL
ncbi:diguanylate cyclase [Eubacteriaceae bacterium ES3]|nr:diguanylate cyclase [Eubacteriaceae bacterium ES3]